MTQFKTGDKVKVNCPTPYQMKEHEGFMNVWTKSMDEVIGKTLVVIDQTQFGVELACELDDNYRFPPGCLEFVNEQVQSDLPVVKIEENKTEVTHEEFKRVMDFVKNSLDNSVNLEYFNTQSNIFGDLYNTAETLIFADKLQEQQEKELLKTLIAKYGVPK